ncbi:MAG: hypothetical protein H6653_09425 [Ardenticatenaceae bacterium]|nr:hypothetical protein [Ardenticatenaceae bacterium]
MTTLEISLLGKPIIHQDGRSLDSLVSRKAEALLCYLAFTGQSHSRQALAGLLWGEMSEEKARRNLRVALSRMRSELEDYLNIQRRTLAFNRERPFKLDITLFETNLQQKNPTIATLKEATDLYRGPFLDDFNLRDAPDFEEWVRLHQEHYRQMALDGLYRLSVMQTEAHQFSDSIATLNRLLKLEPWMEEAHRQLMLLLAVSGQRSAALAQYETCAALLEEELGVEPTSETIALYEKICAEQLDDLLPHLEVRPAPAARPLPPPFQVPPLAPHFVGRNHQQQAIVAALKADADTAVQAIVGMGGVGKSALAAQVAAQLQGHFPDGVLWANVATSEPMSVLESWAQLYGYDFSRVGDVESMAAAFRSAIAEKRVLIVLDDVTSAARIRPLLPAGTHCRALLTMRDQDLARAVNAQVWQLHELSAENGRILFGRILGNERIEAEPDAADAICNELAHLPLAVEITAQRLKSRPRRKLADLAQRLRDEKRRLSLLTISDREVRASFALSWETLGSELKRVFALLGLFGGGSFSAETVAHIAEMDSYLLEDRLYALVALSLLREDGQTRYRQHPLLADFAREQLGDEVEGVYGRFAHYYLQFAQQNQHNYDALRPEWDNLMAAMEAAHTYQLHQTVIDFADTLSDAWFTRGRYSQARQGFERASQAAQHTQDAHTQAKIFRLWGLACLEQRDFDQATKYLFQSSQLCEDSGNSELIAKNQSDLARISVELSDYELAKQRLSFSRSLWQSLGNLEGVAETLHVEARMHYFRGNYMETKELGIQVLEILRNRGQDNKTIRTLSLLASACIMQNDLSSAKSYAQYAFNLSEKTQDKGDQAILLTVLCDISRRQQQFDDALVYGTRSLELLRTIGDLGSQAMVLYHLGRIHKSQSEYDLALSNGLKSLKLCQLSKFDLQMGWTLTHIAECYERLNQSSQAERIWLEAKALAKSLQNPALIKKVADHFTLPTS